MAGRSQWVQVVRDVVHPRDEESAEEEVERAEKGEHVLYGRMPEDCAGISVAPATGGPRTYR